jgi:Kdo2-lipid IVA lauroyltransferase/acyltransferase
VFTDILFFSIVKGFQQFLRLLPEKAAAGVAGLLGGAAYFVLARRRQIAIVNVRRILSNSTDAQARQVVRACFRKLGINFVETLLMPYIGKEEYPQRFTLRNREYVDEALKGGKGILALSFHYGNWEVMGVISRLLGCEIVALARPLKKQKLLNAFLVSLRVSTGLSVIANQDTARDATRHLKENRMVAILGDQREKSSKAIFVDFFGEKVPTSRGIGLLAMKTGAPMIPIYGERNGFLRYTIVFSKPIEIERRPVGGERLEDLLYRNTRKINTFLESIVTEHPDEWLLVHRRFRKPTYSISVK